MSVLDIEKAPVKKKSIAIKFTNEITETLPNSMYHFIPTFAKQHCGIECIHYRPVNLLNRNTFVTVTKNP